MKRLRVKGIIVALSLTLLAACGSDEKNKNISVRITSNPGTVLVGATVSFTVSAENTDFTISAPNDAGCAKSGNTAVSCTPTAAGTYTVTITATADTTKNATATLTVREPVGTNQEPERPSTCQGKHGFSTSPDVDKPYGTNQFIVAVAANFYDAAVAYFDEYVKSGVLDTTITVCSNSTGTFTPEVTAGYYDAFFAANNTATNAFSNKVEGYPEFTYAWGVPVFATKKDLTGITNAKDLITEVSGASATITEGYAAMTAYTVADRLTTKVTPAVGLANASAPYGVRSHRILNAMYGVVNDTPGSLPNNLESWPWVRSPLYGDIDLTLSGMTVDGDVDAVFVGKSQICSNIDEYVYVEFTNPSIILEQRAVLTTNNPAAIKLFDYIKAQRDSGKWNTFVEDNCYIPPTTP